MFNLKARIQANAIPLSSDFTNALLNGKKLFKLIPSNKRFSMCFHWGWM
jgi:hypothetical protein